MKIGDTFYLLKGPGKPFKCYVVAIVDEVMIVYKWYGRHKQRWHYEIEHIDCIRISIRNK